MGLGRCAHGIPGRPFRQDEKEGSHSKWKGKLIEVCKYG